MEHLKTFLVAILSAIVVLVGASLTQTAPQVIVPGVKVGALSSPDIQSPYLSFGGVRRWAGAMDMRAATTTVCAIQSPAATSTLIAATWQITLGTSTAATIDMGTSTTAFATTTNLVAAKSIGSNAQGYATWSSAGANADDAMMAPNTWVVVKTAGAGLNGYTYTGRCQAQFEQI